MEEIESLPEVPESVQRCKEKAIVENELWSFTESLVSDLETCKNENAELRNQLNVVLNEDNSFSHRCLELEEEISEIRNSNRTLKFKLNAQKLQFKSDKTDIKRNCEMEIQKLEEELRIIKQKFHQKEEEFFEELQIAQSTSAYEFEKIEKQLKWQLAEANKHLYESNQINSKLRAQLEDMLNESVRRYKPDDITMLKKMGTTAEQTTNILETVIDASSNPKAESSKKTEKTSNTNSLRTYEPLQIEYSSGHETVSEKQTPPLFKGKFRSSKKMGINKPSFRNIFAVPPLMPCSDATTQKKRKLFDPDDLTYLVDLMSDEN